MPRIDPRTLFSPTILLALALMAANPILLRVAKQSSFRELLPESRKKKELDWRKFPKQPLFPKWLPG